MDNSRSSGGCSGFGCLACRHHFGNKKIQEMFIQGKFQNSVST